MCVEGHFLRSRLLSKVVCEDVCTQAPPDGEQRRIRVLFPNGLDGQADVPARRIRSSKGGRKNK